jgi:sensor histidine kinase regulating citrate/malate metabolism
MGLNADYFHEGLNAYRQAKSIKKARNFTRLNLSMIQDYVYQHHGRMEIDNNPQDGTEIRIYLPG